MDLLKRGFACAVFVFGFDTAVLANSGDGTPDDKPPAEESVCDGLSGAAFGLCNAFCEAQDCDQHPKKSCDQLRSNFQKLTGLAQFPCEGGPVATHTRAFTPTDTPTAGTATPTRTPLSPTATRTAHPTATVCDTATARATMTQTAAPSLTPTPHATATSTAMDTTPEPSELTATPTCDTATPVGTATETPTGPAATATETGVPVGTATATITPAPGNTCDALSGAAFGLCTAFCLAQDCPNNPDQPSCDELRANLEKLTGMLAFPCEGGVGTTPTPTATPSGGHCDCDCGGDGAVTIDDLTHAVLIVLGSQPMDVCPHLHVAGRTSISITDLVRAVIDAANGCS
jgi:hypothetical protein